MKQIIEQARLNQEKVWKVIRQTDIVNIWESNGAEIHLVGSLRTGLLMKHRDIDFHLYSSPVTISDDFKAMARLSETPDTERIIVSPIIKPFFGMAYGLMPNSKHGENKIRSQG